MIILTIKIVSILVVIITLIYSIKEMIKVNTNYQYHFGLGLLLICLSLISLFPQEWVKPSISIGICICIYFFIRIIKQEKLEK